MTHKASPRLRRTRLPRALGFTVCAAALLAAPASGSASSGLDQAPRAHAALEKLAAGEKGRIKVDFVGRWIGIGIGKAVLDYSFEDGAYTSHGSFRTAGIASFLLDDKYQLDGHGSVAAGDVEPAHYLQQALNDRKQRTVTIERKDGLTTAWAEPEYGDLGQPPATQEQKDEARDPLSAILALQVLADRDPDKPCGEPMRVFDGKQRYDLKLTEAGYKDNFRVQAYKGPAIVCHLEFVEVAGFDGKPPEDRAERKSQLRGEVELYLADLRAEWGVTPIVRITAPTGYGRVTVDARKIELTLPKASG